MNGYEKVCFVLYKVMLLKGSSTRKENELCH